MLPFAASTLAYDSAGANPPDLDLHDEVWLGTATASGDTILLDGIDVADYQCLLVYLDGIQAASDVVSLDMQLLTDGVLRNSGHRYVNQSLRDDLSDFKIESQSASALRLTDNVPISSSNGSVAFDITVTNLTSLYKQIGFFQSRVDSTPNAYKAFGASVLENSGTVTGILISSSVAITGTMAVFGLRVNSSPVAQDAALQSMWVGGI